MKEINLSHIFSLLGSYLLLSSLFITSPQLPLHIFSSALCSYLLLSSLFISSPQLPVHIFSSAPCSHLLLNSLFTSSPQLPVHIISSAPCSLTYHLSSYKRNPLSAKSSVSPPKVSTKLPQEIKVKIHQLFTFTTDGSMTSVAELILKKEVMNRKLVPKIILVWWKRKNPYFCE
jgi:hypothetical protein